MKTRLYGIIIFCFLFAFSANAQVFLKVDETRTKATFLNNQLQTELALENSAQNLDANIKVEILDAEDKIIGVSETSQNLKRGRQILPISVNFNQTEDAKNLLWKRLRYTISTANSSVSGIISLSEIMPEVFELQISASEKIFAGMNLRAHVLALHPLTKKPIKNVEISGSLKLDLDTDAEEDELYLKAKGKTNEEGFVSLDFKIPADAKLDDYGELEIKGAKSGIEREADEELEVSPESFVYINTDKPIYQPAQKLFIRGLYLDSLKRPLADKTLDFEIEDQEGETVYKGLATTSRFGVINVEWQIPADFKLGTYRIEFENDDGDVVSAAEFKVSRYDLPNFKVNTETEKSFYLNDQTTANVTVDAEYLFGKPVAAGKVKIVQEKERQWNYEKQEFETETGASIEGETDADGKFTAKVDLSEAQKLLRINEWKRFADVRFAAYFTDLTTNRTEQKRFDIRITKEPIHVYFIRQYNDPNPKIPFLFYVSTFYADGTPVKTDLKVEGVFKNTNLQTKLAEAKTNSYGASKFEIRFPEKPFPEAANEFNFRITADDRKGNRGTLDDNLNIDSNENQLHIRTNKTIYLPNEPIDLKISSSRKEHSVYVDVLRNSSVIYSKLVKIENGSGNLFIPFRPDFKGELTIAAYYRFEAQDYYDNYAIGSKTILYPSSSNLQMNLKSLKAVYRPNEDASVSFNVKNGENKPLETALGVLILDKAIEERADAEQLPDNFGMIRKLLGTSERFGNLTRKDLDNIDLTKPIDEDLQLAAEFLLTGKNIKPNFFVSDSYEDDFSRIYKKNLEKKLNDVERIIKENYEKTGEYPKDEKALRQLLSVNGTDFDSLRDAWNEPFHPTFTSDRSDAVLTFRTFGADKKNETEDDFTVKEMRFEWFRKTQNELDVILNNYIQKTNKMPQTAEELKAVWNDAGFSFDLLRDGWSRPLNIVPIQYERNILKLTQETVGNLDGERQQILRKNMVAQKVVTFKLSSKGADGIENNYDDFDVTSFTVVLEEKNLDAEPVQGKITKQQISGAKGAVGGTVLDPQGAVVAGAKVSAENMTTSEVFTAESNDDGDFLLANLPSGKYKITVDSYAGFMKYVIENVVVSSMNLVKIEIYLQIAAATMTVDVTANEVILETTNSSVATNVTRTEKRSIAGLLGKSENAQSFTPRVREYFPETLLWNPELITDKNGHADLKFKLGDNLTTWKLYAVGSTESGELGLVEKEFQTFQPFFAELDPPKILTEGDQISLPVPIRNYTDKKQKVNVSMTQNDWSKNLDSASQNIEIAPNSTQNAVFNFQAVSAVNEGKQKVTALAKNEGDAIEKSVTVRPNGKEIIETQTVMFDKEAAFNVDFPVDSFMNSRQTELKIYPNMLAHVAEATEGLLKRPYGCGEQTTSSTYPNLLILKIEKELKKELDPKLKAKANEYLLAGYKRLLNYQTQSGGFSYWGKNDKPNIALTAYVLRFLNDAREFIEVDEAVIENAQKWLLSQQKTDGSWENNEKSTAYVSRSLALDLKSDDEMKTSLQNSLAFLQKRLPDTKDPYVLANIALTAEAFGDREIVKSIAGKLQNSAQTENETVFWSVEATNFYGWGKTAQVQTTALVLQVLLKAESETNLSRGLAFLLKNKDKYGVWFSTQTTVNVLDALILLQKERLNRAGTQTEKGEVFVNGKKVNEFSTESDKLIDPIIFDLSQFLSQNNNRIEVKGLRSLNPITVQIVSKHYLRWEAVKEDDKYFDFKIDYSKTEAKIGEEIICAVSAKQATYRYGMLLAEIGLPPGADVDRRSLDQAKMNDEFSNYDVLPDRVLVYFWSSSKGLNFNFKFKPRYGISAQNAPSVIYDYYNEEAKATLAPLKFEVK